MIYKIFKMFSLHFVLVLYKYLQYIVYQIKIIFSQFCLKDQINWEKILRGFKIW